jgi:DNA-binding response OmpR family regulator
MDHLLLPFVADDADIGEFRFSLIARRVVISQDRIVTLTSQEARLLALLLRSPEQIIPGQIQILVGVYALTHMHPHFHRVNIH